MIFSFIIIKKITITFKVININIIVLAYHNKIKINNKIPKFI